MSPPCAIGKGLGFWIEPMNATPSPSFSHTLRRIPKPTHFPPRPHRLLTSHFSIRVLATQNAPKPANSCPQNAQHDPGNLPLWTATEIAEAVNGRIVKWGSPGTISTDTRALEPNQWFFAIAGENFDAHDFITPELSGKGCVGVIGNRVRENWNNGFIEISGDTVNSLVKMANYARKHRFHGALVGVTGSVGKTTTKSMIALAIESLGNRVYQSPGNWNNRIGVALSLIGIPRNAGSVILEMGMSAKGEILELARMARPSIRVILNVGPSHLESFASLAEIALAKGEILEEVEPGDVCVLNADDPLVMSLPIPYGIKKVLFGQREGCDVRLIVAESVDGGLGVRVVLEKNKEKVEFLIPSPGLHLATNACAAAAVATLLGASLPQVGMCLSRFCPVQMRSELEVTKNGIKIVNDIYNANPVSTKAAIDLLKTIDCCGKRVSVLGDMLELGSFEMESHEMILNHCYDSRIDLVGLVGKRYFAAAENLNLFDKINTVHAPDAATLALEIVKRLDCIDVVLVKGSRAMKMERIVDAIKAMNMLSPCL